MYLLVDHRGIIFYSGFIAIRYLSNCLKNVSLIKPLELRSKRCVVVVYINSKKLSNKQKKRVNIDNSYIYTHFHSMKIVEKKNPENINIYIWVQIKPHFLFIL